MGHTFQRWLSAQLRLLETCRFMSKQRLSDNTAVPDQKRTMLMLWSSLHLRLNGNYTKKSL